MKKIMTIACLAFIGSAGAMPAFAKSAYASKAQSVLEKNQEQFEIAGENRTPRSSMKGTKRNYNKPGKAYRSDQDKDRIRNRDCSKDGTCDQDKDQIRDRDRLKDGTGDKDKDQIRSRDHLKDETGDKDKDQIRDRDRIHQN